MPEPRPRRWRCGACGKHLGLVLFTDRVRLIITPFDEPDNRADRHTIEAALPVECTCGQCGSWNMLEHFADCEEPEV